VVCSASFGIPAQRHWLCSCIGKPDAYNRSSMTHNEANKTLPGPVDRSKTAAEGEEFSRLHAPNCAWGTLLA
jgi:hypothetical protein